MQRLLLNQLHQWRQQPKRKPLLIDGARQTGKTYLLKNLFGRYFKRVLRIDFLESPNIADAFLDSLDPTDIITNLELLTNQSFNPQDDLLILDEIGECERAMTALKYFAEQAPSWFVVASGSNIGLLNSFPVGKVVQHVLRPFSFYEFLLASNEAVLIKAFEQQLNNAAVHKKLMDKLTDYYFVGGMPEAVYTWYSLKNTSILSRIEQVRQVQADLITGYQRDFGKYSGKVDASLISSVFNAIPNQLAMVQDESVKRFKFKGVYQRKSRYLELVDGISWLDKSRLALKNHPITGLPKSPLAAYKKENLFKFFLFDVGLLNYQLGASYQQIKQQSYEYKGYIAENFVQQELAALNIEPTYSWNDARAEIEFILANPSGQIVPIEVKSGQRTRAKSLDSYKQKCRPSKTIKLTGTQGSSPLAQTDLVYPLYYAQHAINTHQLK